MNRRIIAVLAAAALILLSSCQSIMNDAGTKPYVSVSGIGEVRAEADQASFTIQAEAVRDTGEDARSDASLLINKAIGILTEEFGVEREDLKTGYISISPYYEWVDGNRVIKGQCASESVNVELDDISIAGTVFERLSSVNGLSISSISLDKHDKAEMIEKARAEAVLDARAKAEAYAAALGMNVGSVISISDDAGSYSVSAPRYANAIMAKAEAADSSSATVYYAGDVVVRDSVSAVFSLEH